LPVLRGRTLSRAALVLGLALLRASPAAADGQTIGTACTTGADSAAVSLNGNNDWCNGSTWQYPPYQFGAAPSSTCNSTNAGMVQWTGSVLEYCNGSAWTPFKRCTETAYTALSAYPGCCGTTNAVYSDGTYIYNADTSTGLLAYTFNGSSFTNVATQSIQTQGFYGVTKGGSTIFTAEGSDGIRAFTFNGSAFTQKASKSSTDATDIWSNGSDVFVADNTGGLRAYSFSGSAFTLNSTYAPASTKITSVWSDGTYVYAIDYNNNLLYALSYSGGSLSAIASTAPTAYLTNSSAMVTGDGTYIYAASSYYGGNTVDLDAYTFNGSSFTRVGTFNSLEHLGDMRPSTLVFQLTQRLLYTKWRDPGEEPKLHLFGQLKRITKQWLDTCLVCKGGTYPALLMYQELADMACNRITAAITREFLGERPIMRWAWRDCRTS
jgi:hypothetical protein